MRLLTKCNVFLMLACLTETCIQLPQESITAFTKACQCPNPGGLSNVHVPLSHIQGLLNTLFTRHQSATNVHGSREGWLLGPGPTLSFPIKKLGQLCMYVTGNTSQSSLLSQIHSLYFVHTQCNGIGTAAVPAGKFWCWRRTR